MSQVYFQWLILYCFNTTHCSSLYASRPKHISIGEKVQDCNVSPGLWGRGVSIAGSGSLLTTLAGVLRLAGQQPRYPMLPLAFKAGVFPLEGSDGWLRESKALSPTIFLRGRKAVGSMLRDPVVCIQPWPECWGQLGSSLAALCCFSLSRPGSFSLRGSLVRWESKAQMAALSLAMFLQGRKAAGSILWNPVVCLQLWPERWGWQGCSPKPALAFDPGLVNTT